MSAARLGAFIELKSIPKITNPTAVIRRDTSGLPASPPQDQLDEIQWGERLNGPEISPTTPRSPRTLSELEMSSPGTTCPGRASEIVQSISNPPMNKWRFQASCLMSLANGLNDGATGSLIPYMERYYSIGYAVVSLIFVAQAIGFIVAAPITSTIEMRIGRAKSFMLAEVSMCLAYIIILCTPPFPVTVVGYFLVGFGLAVNLALNNVFCANLAKNTITLGALHGFYGVGGTIGPLIGTSLVSHGARWSYFFAIPLGLTATNVLLAGWTFWNFEKDISSDPQASSAELIPAHPETTQEEPTKTQLVKQAIKNQVTLLGSLFIFAYQGAEVSISGWVITFLINYRDGAPSKVGYVTSGFWAGITLGRFLLSHPVQKIGKKLAIVLLVIGSIAFELVVWLIPNIIGDAVAVSIVGLLLGPVYPCSAAVFTQLLPRNIQVSSLSFISAMGSSGGAVAPFFTGILAQTVGSFVLHPIAIGLFVVMEVCWACLPRLDKRDE
ncbi:MAG: hypothetical protein M1834_005711 [Cirrosporium novae-zelandiae]|nr:MAG: hypothetical protein M1834_005711 [Cirrosporium novae-zelandiae]